MEKVRRVFNFFCVLYKKRPLERDILHQHTHNKINIVLVYLNEFFVLCLFGREKKFIFNLNKNNLCVYSFFW